AFATGIGSSDMACAWALGELWFRVPETIKVEVKGEIPLYSSPKDLALTIVSTIGESGAVYKALEFTGSGIEKMGTDGRFTLCNMAIEMGAKTGIISPDEVTRGFLKEVGMDWCEEWRELYSDNDSYERVVEIDGDRIEPVVAAPYSPANVIPARECREVKVDQVVIGSCTNGRWDDFESVAELLNGFKVHPDVRLIFIPSTPRILKRLIDEGLAEKFLEAGGVIAPPTCGPCIGGHMGVLARGEVGLYTTNRNFRGRTGHPESRVFLGSPQVAIATAITGFITDPRDL
ncbi:MAG: aconitase family protein, partial [bacterium]